MSSDAGSGSAATGGSSASGSGGSSSGASGVVVGSISGGGRAVSLDDWIEEDSRESITNMGIASPQRPPAPVTVTAVGAGAD